MKIEHENSLILAEAGKYLHGWSYEKAHLMGMPNVESDFCMVCGINMASNKHHIVPKGPGCANKKMALHMRTLYSPTIPVCGCGTSGCHDGFHGGCNHKIRWRWYDPAQAIDWWSGEFFIDGIFEHDEYLWECGYYEIYEVGTKEIICYIVNGSRSSIPF